ncbi:Uncharacterised protein [Mycobacteroides abscessus subsp. massiliense]|nr:Uncharacterised protein [Mycobacteroides abscessus subsp. massiliense]
MHQGLDLPEIIGAKKEIFNASNEALPTFGTGDWHAIAANLAGAEYLADQAQALHQATPSSQPPRPASQHTSSRNALIFDRLDHNLIQPRTTSDPRSGSCGPELSRSKTCRSATNHRSRRPTDATASTTTRRTTY